MTKTKLWTLIALIGLVASAFLPGMAVAQNETDEGDDDTDAETNETDNPSNDTGGATGGPGSTTTGEDNEFGSIRMFQQTKVEPGVATPIEAKVNLRTHYQDKDGTFFMFGVTGEQTPLTVTLESVRTADRELPVFQKDANGKVAKWFVDIQDMPEVGTEIIIEGTVKAPEAGLWQAGAIVVPFTYTWEKIQMSSGIEAKLYGFTEVAAGGEPGKTGFSGGGNKLPVPGVSAIAVPAVAGLVAVAFAATRGRERS